MVYSYDKIYRSIVYFVAQLVPSGVRVVDGESYGVRLANPEGYSPSIAVDVTETRDIALELGSASAVFDSIFTISAVSRIQRDALKTIVHSGLLYKQIPIYTAFEDFTPIDFTVERYIGIGDYFSIKDMLNFDTDRDKFFWVSVVFVSLNLLNFP